MKTILPDAKSHEEHDATKYSHRMKDGQVTGFLCVHVVEIIEK